MGVSRYLFKATFLGSMKQESLVVTVWSFSLYMQKFVYIFVFIFVYIYISFFFPSVVSFSKDENLGYLVKLCLLSFLIPSLFFFYMY